jgi:hypothetical protein
MILFSLKSPRYYIGFFFFFFFFAFVFLWRRGIPKTFQILQDLRIRLPLSFISKREGEVNTDMIYHPEWERCKYEIHESQILKHMLEKLYWPEFSDGREKSLLLLIFLVAVCSFPTTCITLWFPSKCLWLGVSVQHTHNVRNSRDCHSRSSKLSHTEETGVSQHFKN